MSALAMDVRELNSEELNDVAGGPIPVIPAIALALGAATFLMMVGERLHDANCPDHH